MTTGGLMLGKLGENSARAAALHVVSVRDGSSVARICPLVVLVVWLLPKPALAQESQFSSFHTWTDIATIKNYNDRFRYDGDYGTRGLVTDEDWALVYLRPSVRYRSKSWLTLHGGAALFYNFFEGTDLPELRPWVGARFLTQLPKGWRLTNYLRLEYRAFYIKDKSHWDAYLRGRWQLQVVSPHFTISSRRGFYGLASVEPFFNSNSSLEGTFGDRFRINFGLGKQVKDNLRAEINYLFHIIRVPEQGGDLDYDDHVLRLRFFYTMR